MKHNNKNMVFKAFLLTVPKFWFGFGLVFILKSGMRLCTK